MASEGRQTPGGRPILPKRDRYRELSPEAVLGEAWGIDAPPASWVVDRGYTGKEHARLLGPSGALLLRRYPPGTSQPWLDEVHAAVSYLERRGFRLFPSFQATESGETVVHHSGYLYDLAPLIGGASIPLADLDRVELVSLGAAVARLHGAGSGARGPEVRLDRLTGRFAGVQRLAWDPVPRGKDAWQRPETLAAFFAPLDTPDAPTHADETARGIVEVAIAALRWLDQAPPAADLAADPPTLAHGDLWPDHVRFSGAEVSGLLDLDTLAVRPPLGDLAALCDDFALWDLARCRAVIQGYRQERPVPPASVAALPRLAVLRTLGVLRARLRAWLDPEQRSAPFASLGGPVPYWRDQLRTLLALDLAAFGEL
jgi:Ser/Thr protein kinase RdoA (MazF antagonist)